ncbi:hypothetical protein VAE122_3060143 [Vibrio aestuarianus]|nr:hypothetical protein VAE122_3060143 [Vibrio aestuarianus]
MQAEIDTSILQEVTSIGATHIELMLHENTVSPNAILSI